MALVESWEYHPYLTDKETDSEKSQSTASGSEGIRSFISASTLLAVPQLPSFIRKVANHLVSSLSVQAGYFGLPCFQGSTLVLLYILLSYINKITKRNM